MGIVGFEKSIACARKTTTTSTYKGLERLAALQPFVMVYILTLFFMEETELLRNQNRAKSTLFGRFSDFILNLKKAFRNAF